VLSTEVSKSILLFLRRADITVAQRLGKGFVSLVNLVLRIAYFAWVKLIAEYKNLVVY
jgi:hypothetical protein